MSMIKLSLDKFRGINNVLNEKGLSKEWLTKAENVFISNDYKIVPAPSPVLITDKPAHSLWCKENVCLFRSGKSLYRLAGDTPLELTGSLHEEEIPMSYLLIDDYVYFSDMLTNGKIDLVTNEVKEWGIAPPEELTVENAYGFLPSGSYLVAITYSDSDGQESGASKIMSVNTNTGGIHVSFKPSKKYYTNIYISAPNSKELYFHTRLQPDASGYIIYSEKYEAPLKTLNRIKPPLGSSLAFFLGSIFIASYDILYFTDIYNYNCVSIDNFIKFENEIKDICSTSNFLYVATENCIYSIDNSMKLTEILHDKIVAISPVSTKAGEILMCVTKSGILLVGLSEIQNVTENYYQPDFEKASVVEEKEYIFLVRR